MSGTIVLKNSKPTRNPIQDRPLRDNNGATKTIDNLKLLLFADAMVKKIDSLNNSFVCIHYKVEMRKLFADMNRTTFRTKHPVKDKFHKTHFLEEIYKSEKNLRQNGASHEKLCEIEASAKWHAKNLRETPVDRGPSKVTNYFKEHDLLLVPFDKRNGFCVMGKSRYQTKLDQILDCPQISRIDLSDDIIAKIENNINSTSLEMRKKNLISENLSEVRSTGAKTT